MAHLDAKLKEIDEKTYLMSKKVAHSKGQTLAEYVRDTLAERLRRDWDAVRISPTKITTDTLPKKGDLAGDRR